MALPPAYTFSAHWECTPMGAPPPSSDNCMLPGCLNSCVLVVEVTGNLGTPPSCSIAGNVPATGGSGAGGGGGGGSRGNRALH